MILVKVFDMDIVLKRKRDFIKRIYNPIDAASFYSLYFIIRTYCIFAH